MLALVLADRHRIDVVEQDVRGLQHGIGEEADGDEVLLLGLVLELRHAAELAVARRARQQPGALRMIGVVALDEERAALGIEPGGEEEGGQGERRLPEILGVVRHRDRVEVDDADEGLALVLGVDPLPDRPDVVAEVLVAGGLDAAEDPH